MPWSHTAWVWSSYHLGQLPVILQDSVSMINLLNSVTILIFLHRFSPFPQYGGQFCTSVVTDYSCIGHVLLHSMNYNLLLWQIVLHQLYIDIYTFAKVHRLSSGCTEFELLDKRIYTLNFFSHCQIAFDKEGKPQSL